MEAMCEELRKLRSSNALPSDCSIALTETAGEIHIVRTRACAGRSLCCGSCRAWRPRWSAAGARRCGRRSGGGIVVMIDKEEEQAVVASTPAEVDAADAPEHRLRTLRFTRRSCSGSRPP